eukprot:s1010_g10.t1
MCSQEMKVHGAPDDWTTYFEQNGAVQIRCQLEDITVKQPQRAENEYVALRQACLCTWKCNCLQLWLWSIWAVSENQPTHILFHCFGGINRSTAVLCAWLVIGYGCTAKESIEVVLCRRPSLRPWKHRDYVLEALYIVEKERGQWQREFAALTA